MLSADIIGLLADELVHLSVTAMVAAFIWWRFRNWKLIIIVFLVGIFIDLDHWFDYFAYFGFNINLSNFFNGESYIHANNKVFVPLHGWDLLVFYWLISYFLEKKLKIKGLSWAIVLAYVGHLLWDQISVSPHPLGYFFFYRLVNNFDLGAFNGIK